jgi:AhpD family alkylhydroperoxidase
MKLIKTLAAVAMLGAAFLSQANAEEAMTAEQAYQEMQSAFGTVPGFMKAYPKSAITGMWQVTKNFEMSDKTALDGKTKALIGVAVAAQIPCRYCIWLDTETAKQHGASEQEIAEAVTMAAMTRHWSTVINGMQIDFETFKSEFGGGS